MCLFTEVFFFIPWKSGDVLCSAGFFGSVFLFILEIIYMQVSMFPV